MTITRRPPRAALATPRRPKNAESFIESATVADQMPVPGRSEKKKDKHKLKDKAKELKIAKPDKKRKDKEAVLIRFEEKQLAALDARAAALGLSRAAWLRMLVAKALMDQRD